MGTTASGPDTRRGKESARSAMRLSAPAITTDSIWRKQRRREITPSSTGTFPYEALEHVLHPWIFFNFMAAIKSGLLCWLLVFFSITKGPDSFNASRMALGCLARRLNGNMSHFLENISCCSLDCSILYYGRVG